MVSALRLMCIATALALVVGVATAQADGPVGSDPPSNFTLGKMPSSCRSAPQATSCENAAIYYLDEARASLDQPPYDLPSDFTALTEAEQAFVLTNLDRILYGLPPITGLTAPLGSDAAGGVQADDDPRSSDPSFDYYTSNWAGGYPNMPAAYEGWMYDDGPGSGNLDCTPSDSSGCWGHRHDILWRFDGTGGLAMGAATGQDPSGTPGQAMLLGEGQSGYAPSYNYTWSQAQADGAGTNPYDPGAPQVPVSVTVTAIGPGTVTDPNGATCANQTCTFHETQGQPATFTATPATGARFGGWSGACNGQSTCTITPYGSATTIQAGFAGVGQTPPATTPASVRSGSAAPASDSAPASASASHRLGVPAVNRPLSIAQLKIAKNVVRIRLTGSASRPLRCALARRLHHGWTRAQVRSCATTVVYHGLPRGRYRFSVRAGTASASRQFTVKAHRA